MADVYFSYIGAKGYQYQATTSTTTQLGGLTMNGNIGMGGSNKITGLGAATGSGEALVYGQASASLASLTMSGAIAMGTSKITGLGAPSASDDAATKGYVDTLIVTGGRIKEAVLDAVQLDNTDGINAAEVLYFTAQPDDTTPDTVTFKNGTLTRTYTFVANQGAESLATDVSKETSAVTAMQRLVTRMNADVGNTEWSAVFVATPISRINANGAIIVYEKASASGASDSRIYGVWTGHQTDAQVVQFASGATPTVDTEYSRTASAALPSTDPAAGRFGFRRQTSALVDCEIHADLDGEALYAWDSDASAWVTLSGGSSIPDATSGSGGGTKGKITVDSDYGLLVTSGKLTINLATDPGLQFTTDGAVKKLAAKANTSAGIQITSSGIEAKVLSTGAIIAGASGLYVNLESSNPTLAITTNQLGVKFDTAKGLATGSTGLAVAIDSVTVTFNGSGQLVATDATSVNVSAAVAKGDPLYASGDDTVAKADTTDTANKANVVGLALAAQATVGNPVRFASSGVITGILSGDPDAGTEFWLANGGGLTVTRPGTGNRLIRCGFAKNATDLYVKIDDFGYIP